jgi:hypothetical protein
MKGAIMAKISIEDRTEKSGPEGKTGILPFPTIQRLYNATAATLERLGDATKFIEVIKINPLEVSPSVEFIGVRLVIVATEPYSGEKTRMERFFQIFCNKDGLEDLLSQKIVRNFQEALATQAERFRKQAETFSQTLTVLGAREQKSGNYKRCNFCGHMPAEGEKGKACSRCFQLSLH